MSLEREQWAVAYKRKVGRKYLLQEFVPQALLLLVAWGVFEFIHLLSRS